MRVKCASLAWHTMKAALEGGATGLDGVKAWRRESRTVSRDVEVAAIPYGGRSAEGRHHRLLTQSLGGSFTVDDGHGLHGPHRGQGRRRDRRDARCAAAAPEELAGKRAQELAWDQLKTCFDPEIPVNIVDLGLVYQCDVAEPARAASKVAVRFTLTAPGCGMGDYLREDVKAKLLTLPGVKEADVQVVLRAAVGPER